MYLFIGINITEIRTRKKNLLREIINICINVFFYKFCKNVINLYRKANWISYSPSTNNSLHMQSNYS